MAYDITTLSRAGFSLKELLELIASLKARIIEEGDVQITSTSSPGLSISFGSNAPMTSELLRAARYALFRLDPSNSEFKSGEIVREQTGIIV